MYIVVIEINDAGLIKVTITSLTYIVYGVAILHAACVSNSITVGPLIYCLTWVDQGE